jgi:hypothetical protein
MWETMQAFAILMASMGVVVAFVYHFSSWSVFLTACTLVVLLFVAVAFLWRNLRQFNWKNETDLE